MDAGASAAARHWMDPGEPSAQALESITDTVATIGDRIVEFVAEQLAADGSTEAVERALKDAGVWPAVEAITARFSQRAADADPATATAIGERAAGPPSTVGVAALALYVAVTGWVPIQLGPDATWDTLSDEELGRRMRSVWQSEQFRDALAPKALEATRTLAQLVEALEAAPPMADGKDPFMVALRLVAARIVHAPLRPPRPPPLPEQLPQQTFPEAKTLTAAIADGPSLRGWTPLAGEIAMVHADGEKLSTKLVGTPLLDWLGLEHSTESLRAELKRAGVPAALLLHIVLGSALERMNAGSAFVTTSIDELIGRIGWHPKSAKERQRMRRDVWRWLALFHSTEIIGRRAGRFRDPSTGATIETDIHSALVQVVERQTPAQLAFDDSVPPLEVTCVAGPWLLRLKGNHRVLSYFGDIDKVAAIPARRPSGAWAQAVGLALQQLWRQRATHDPRDAQAWTFTRRELLEMFRPKPTVHEILSSKDPGHAKAYWKGAIGLLREKGLVATYGELGPLDVNRLRWADAWLDQPLEIKPTDGALQAMAEIAVRARARSKALARRAKSTSST